MHIFTLDCWWKKLLLVLCFTGISAFIFSGLALKLILLIAVVWTCSIFTDAVRAKKEKENTEINKHLRNVPWRPSYSIKPSTSYCSYAWSASSFASHETTKKNKKHKKRKFNPYELDPERTYIEFALGQDIRNASADEIEIARLMAQGLAFNQNNH